MHVFESCRTKIEFDVISYGAAISACKNAGLWRVALMLLQRAYDFGDVSVDIEKGV